MLYDGRTSDLEHHSQDFPNKKNPQGAYCKKKKQNKTILRSVSKMF